MFTPILLRRRPMFTVIAAGLALTVSASAEIIINELDADQPGTDSAEFLELYDGGVGNSDLSSYFLVMFNGSTNRAYATISLAGKTTTATGYFVMGNSGVPNNGMMQPVNFLQNGSDAGAEGDAAALCTGAIGDILIGGSGTLVGAIPVSVTVVDAVVYDGGGVLSGNDVDLLNGLGMPGQNMVYDSNLANSSAGRPNNAGGLKTMGAWSSLPTVSPGGSNTAADTLSLSFAPASFDESDGAGASTGTVTRSGPTVSAVTVTLTSSDASEATVPATVLIPAGSASAPFPVDAVNDGWNDGTHVVTISVTATLYASGSGNVSVNDEGDPPALLVVNEVHATGRGDANGDGTNANFGQDEFVEIVNVSAAAVNLSGWTLRETAGMADPLQIRHTFPANSFLNAGCALVVFGGGNPVEGRTAAFGNAWIIKANGNAANGLSLNDTGDVVSLMNAGAVEMAGIAYASIAPADNTKSINRNPDLTGPNALVVHTNVPGAGAALYSPGTKVDGTRYCTLTDSLSVALSPSSVVENSGAHVNLLTVTRPAPGTAAVFVRLTSSDITEATPALASVLLGPGVLSQSVTVNAPDDGVADGTQSATFTASAEGYLNGSAVLTVTDDGLDIPLAAIFINELDCDQLGTDAGEFIELYDGGLGNRTMDGFIVVLYNGASDQSYLTLDLAGYRTNAQGYFLIGNAGVPGVGLIIPDNTLQNGPDAVAIYLAGAASFPVGTTVTAATLKEAVVYSTGDPDDTGLLNVLTPGLIQASETSNSAGFALARLPNATTAFQPGQFVIQAPTPGFSNVNTTIYQNWAAGFAGLGAPGADPDNDGLLNFIEYGLGTDPLVGSGSPIAVPAFVGGNLRYSITKGTAAGSDPATQYFPEVSTNLVNWTTTGLTIVTNNSTTLTFDYTGLSPRVQMRARIVVTP